MSVTIKGLEDLHRKLQALDRAADKDRNKAIVAGARVLVAPMRAAAPKVTGTLRKSVKVSNRRGSVSVGPTARHRHLVIRGTRPHEIRPKDDGSLRFGGGHAEVVHHPGSKGNPFVDRAFRANRERVLDTIRKHIWAKLR